MNGEAIAIVRAGPERLPDARALLYAYFDLIGVVLRDDDAAIAGLLTDASSAMWIAYVDGRPAGCVALRPLKSPPAGDEGGAAECKRLYVADAFRRRGLAEKLMAALESHAAGKGITAVYLDSKDDLQAAIQLYRRLGYADCPRYNDNPQATVFMRKRLSR